MKKTLILLSAALALVATLSSCSKEDPDNYNKYFANAIVTVKTDASGLLLQLDDSTTLRATNLSKSPYKSAEVRALCNLTMDGKILPGKENKVLVNWLDSVVTKTSIPYAESMKLHNDPLEIMNDWTTVVEDGYLTIRFQTWFGNKKHTIGAITGANEKDPYEILLTHDAADDFHGRVADGIISFRLADLPSTEGKYVPLTLKWTSFSGEKTVKFKYKSRD